MKVNYRKLKNGNYLGRYGKYYIYLKVKKHYVREGFKTFRSWWTAIITLNKEVVQSEGVLGSSLGTLKKAKKWVKGKLFIMSLTKP